MTTARNSIRRSVLATIFIILAALNLAMPSQARYLSPDTWDPMLPGVDFNRYAYCGNDPINCSDPNGHDPYEEMMRQILGGVPGGTTVDDAAIERYGQEVVKNGVSALQTYSEVGMIATGSVAAGGAAFGVVVLAPETAAGAAVGGALKTVTSSVVREFKQLKFEGPKINEQYGTGRIFQVRYKGQTLVVRLDYNRMKGSQFQPRLHFNVQVGGSNYHISVDPRSFNDGAKRSAGNSNTQSGGSSLGAAISRIFESIGNLFRSGSNQ